MKREEEGERGDERKEGRAGKGEGRRVKREKGGREEI